MSIQFFSGIPVYVPNKITRSDNRFYVSYNPSKRDYGTDTTALVIHETSQFLILAGNHSKAYEGLDFDQSLAYFYANIDRVVPQSEHGMIFKMAEDGKASYVKGGY